MYARLEVCLTITILSILTCSVIDIIKAKDDLMSINNIGEKRAKSIIALRKTKGEYHSHEITRNQRG